jgi:hypothetical protein
MLLDQTTTVSKSKPKGWPADVVHISASTYHSSVPKEIFSQLRGSKPSKGVLPCPLVRIRRIDEAGHPAKGQSGLFAAKKVPPNTFILFYLGEVHADAREASDYDLSLFRTQEGISIGVDAQKMGNEARFINDYRGVAAKPNAIFKEMRTEAGELHMSIWSATTEIKKGEEILVSYGKRWWNARTENSSTSALGEVIPWFGRLVGMFRKQVTHSHRLTAGACCAHNSGLMTEPPTRCKQTSMVP